MKENKKRLIEFGFHVVILDDLNTVSKDVDVQRELDDAEFIFTSAEALLSIERFRNMLLLDKYTNMDILMVIDEAHTIVNWLDIQLI